MAPLKHQYLKISPTDFSDALWEHITLNVWQIYLNYDRCKRTPICKSSTAKKWGVKNLPQPFVDYVFPVINSHLRDTPNVIVSGNAVLQFANNRNQAQNRRFTKLKRRSIQLWNRLRESKYYWRWWVTDGVTFQVSQNVWRFLTFGFVSHNNHIKRKPTQ